MIHALVALASVVDALPPPVRPLPQQVYRAFQNVASDLRSYEVPPSPSADRLVVADFDGNGKDDWAVVSRNRVSWAVLVAYRMTDEWRVGTVDVWPSSLGPVTIRLLEPGSYDRQPPYNRPKAANEVEELAARTPGLVATLSDGQQRAYALGAHAWLYVYLGKAPRK